VPQYLSQSAFILGVGLATNTWHHAMLWAEAGEAAGYLANHPGGRLAPDYRGGVSYSRATGRLLGAEAPGWFAETNGDGVFVSRFQNDFLVYSQNRSGYTLPALGGFRSQFFAAGNITLDTQRQYWANFVELGPVCAFDGTACRPRWSSRSTCCAASTPLTPGTRAVRTSSICAPVSGMRLHASFLLLVFSATLFRAADLLPDPWRGPGKLAGHSLFSRISAPDSRRPPRHLGAARRGGRSRRALARSCRLRRFSSFWKAPPRLPKLSVSGLLAGGCGFRMCKTFAARICR